MAPQLGHVTIFSNQICDPFASFIGKIIEGTKKKEKNKNQVKHKYKIAILFSNIKK